MEFPRGVGAPGLASAMHWLTLCGIRATCQTPAPDEAAVVNYGREFFRTHHVSRGSFQAAQEQFGVQGLVELTILMGYYGLLAFNVNAFDTDLVPQRTEQILPV